MKDSLDHLPSNKQTHLRRILQVIREEFDSVVSAASGKRKTGKLIKVILFGSHATGKWVNKPETGYISDYDILVIVNQYDLVAKLDLWNTIEDNVT
ncbi:nucleotidyltransferase domain-containing protein [Isorropodon fossajaponicum symbiont]|uniref:nucleotidyltransferase domain-containing protein n=1 Tax=Isorropodon fossajaponicum symbiont TaxID=883811 RepID=UPI0019151F78|nr:nucleotidyltransferase domain-containing protein [Isorropodon fossajaponicum symbiont]